MNETLPRLEDAPPARDEIAAKLHSLLAGGRTISTIAAADLLGLHENEIELLRPQAQAAPDYRFYAAELHVQVLQSGEAAMLRVDALGGYAKAHEVTQLFARATRPLARPALLVTSAKRPEHPLLVEQAPERCLVVCCPIVTESAERVSFGGFHFDCDPLENAPAGWAPIRVSRRTLGWVEPSGRALRLRFHPFIRNGRLTTSRAEQRVEALQALIGLALQQTEQPVQATVIDLDAWQTQLAFAESLLGALEGSGAQLQSRLAAHERQAREARTRIDQLVEDLCAALQAEEQAQRQAAALVPELQQTQLAAAELLLGTLERLEALPQLESVALHGATLVLQTGSLTVELATVPRTPLLRLTNGRHPLAAANGTVDLGESFLPLARAVADGNLVGACQLALGALAAAANS